MNIPYQFKISLVLLLASVIVLFITHYVFSLTDSNIIKIFSFFCFFLVAAISSSMLFLISCSLDEKSKINKEKAMSEMEKIVKI